MAYEFSATHGIGVTEIEDWMQQFSERDLVWEEILKRAGMELTATFGKVHSAFFFHVYRIFPTTGPVPYRYMAEVLMDDVTMAMYYLPTDHDLMEFLRLYAPVADQRHGH
jgi:hypothetical protein